MAVPSLSGPERADEDRGDRTRSLSFIYELPCHEPSEDVHMNVANVDLNYILACSENVGGLGIRGA